MWYYFKRVCVELAYFYWHLCRDTKNAGECFTKSHGKFNSWMNARLKGYPAEGKHCPTCLGYTEYFCGHLKRSKLRCECHPRIVNWGDYRLDNSLLCRKDDFPCPRCQIVHASRRALEAHLRGCHHDVRGDLSLMYGYHSQAHREACYTKAKVDPLVKNYVEAICEADRKKMTEEGWVFTTDIAYNCKTNE